MGRINKKDLLKTYLFLLLSGLILTLGALVFIFNANSDSKIGEVSANEGVWWDHSWAFQNANCRRDDNSCNARAEFRDNNNGNLLQAGQMLYCRGNVGTDSQGLIYGNWVVDNISACSNNNGLCDNRSGYFPGGRNNGAQCGNPYRCAEIPRGSVQVRAVCEDGDRRNVSGLNFSVSRGGQYAFATSRQTSSGTVTVDFERTFPVDVFFSNDVVDRARQLTGFNNLTWSRTVVANGSGNCSGTGCTGVANGGIVEIAFRNCTAPTQTPTPIRTPTPTPSPSPTPTRVPQNPNIEVTKVLIGPRYVQFDANNRPIIAFNINVRNTGDTDIRDFTMEDQFYSNYLEYVSTVYRGNQINVSQTTNNGNVRTIRWDNLPPKSSVIPGEDGVLTVGEIMTFTVSFRVLQPLSTNLVAENDNCAVVGAITVNNNGQNETINLNPPRRSCDEVFTTTPGQIRAQITKTTITQEVNVGQEVRFRAVINNNDTEQRTYSDIDFSDEYDSRYLRPLRFTITAPNGNNATCNFGTGNSCNLTYRVNGSNQTIAINGVNPLRIDNLQNIIGNSELLGNLAFGQNMTIELVFEARAPISRTCDTVYASVSDGNLGGNTNRAEACAEINSPIPPKTGANIWINLITPLVAIASSVLVKKRLA